LAAQARSYLSSDLDLALLLGVEAYRVFQTAEAESVLRDALDRKASRAAEPLPGRPIPRQNSPIYTVAFSPDGQLLAWGSDDGSVALWDMSTQRQRLLGGHTGRTYTVAFSPDGKILASGGQDGVIILWEVATGQDITSFRRTSNAWALSLTFNPDGLEMVIGHTGSTLSMWNIADSGNPAFVRSLARGHRDDVWSVAWSPDGAQLASGSADGTVRVWDPETGDALLTPEKLHTDIVWSVAWSPDGKWLASGSRDSTIVLWSAATGEPLGPPLKGHTGEVFSVAVSPDGKLLASGSADRSIILWDVSSPEAPKEIIRLQDDHTNSVRTLAFSPVRNETILASGGFDRTIVLRRIIVPPPTDQPLDAQACAAAGRPFTQEEWDLFFPGQAYAPPCKGP
ncbi:MAG: WD40 repeat domain-containing protein, partial [Anaerolineales bacterium]